jgi:hypothetical protein
MGYIACPLLAFFFSSIMISPPGFAALGLLQVKERPFDRAGEVTFSRADMWMSPPPYAPVYV